MQRSVFANKKLLMPTRLNIPLQVIVNMNFPVYDLHCHTTASDGDLSPAVLLNLAVEKGIKVLAITDHDTVAGTLEVLKLQQEGVLPNTVRIIPGVELTSVLDNQMLHIVALDFDLEHPALTNHLDHLSFLREERAARIAQKLEKKKLPNILSLVYEKAAGAQIGRPHFAKVLFDLGIVNTEAEAFKKYLGAGKIANVKVEWPELETVLELIKKCDGISVLAHPTKYNLTMSKLRRIISAFKILDGDAIEFSYPGINREQQNILMYEVEKHQLLISAGSDFHTPANKWTELGRYPEITQNLPHVLNKCKQM
jgi:predicted metal-dependent phosphoesterase TrpH